MQSNAVRGIPIDLDSCLENFYFSLQFTGFFKNAISNGADVEAVVTTGSETKRDAELTEMCLLTASGFYRKSGESRGNW